MSIILDLIVIAIIILFAFFSAKQGFVRVVLEVVGLIAATVLAFAVSNPLAGVTYDKFIEPSLIEAFEEEIGSMADTELNIEAEKKALESLPDFVSENYERLGFSMEKFSDTLNENIEKGASAAAGAVSQEVIKPVAVNILALLYAAIIMFILSFVVKFIAKSVNKLFSFSIAGKLNRFLGGLVGILKGVIFSVFFCGLIWLLVSFTQNGFFIFTAENIENTFIFKNLIELIPFKI